MPTIPAARNALGILRYLGERAAPARASSIARELQLPRSSVYQLLRVLMDEGFVIHYPEHRSYGPSTLMAELGAAPRRAAQLTRLATPLLERLVPHAPIPVVAHLALLSGADVIYLARVQGFRAPTTVTGIGVRLPAHLAATGRSMLALLPRDQVRALYPDRGSLIRRNDRGPTRLGELERVLREARERGWADEDGEITEDYASTGAAASDATGYPAAAVGLTFRSSTAGAEHRRLLGEAVVVTAREITARLAGRH
ncbi:MAG: IclR family transcriptional regulator [Leifsonia xyli]|nr:MAG: IclR family transcriptional regulator [Leifsonia xyli]